MSGWKWYTLIGRLFRKETDTFNCINPLFSGKAKQHMFSKHTAQGSYQVSKRWILKTFSCSKIWLVHESLCHCPLREL